METFIFSSILNAASNSNSFNEIASPTINTFPPTSQMKKYWCHLCKKEFSHIYDDTIDINCLYCGKTFCEILETDDISNESHPIHFKPYIVNENNNANNQPNNNNNTNNNTNSNPINNENNNAINNDNNNSNNNSNNIRNNLITFFPPIFISNIIIGNSNSDNLDNIINEIMLHDTNKYGNPPASKKEIEKLKKCKINEEKIKEFGIENSCAVCKEEFIIGEECLLMPCNHHFHGNCLIPWLKERNSCPVCRYELPTDDEDFELRKKQKLINNTNNVQG